MSNSNSQSTFKAFSSSYSSSTVNGQTTSHSENKYSDPSGTKVHRTSQEPGQAPREERYEVDANGRRIQESGNHGARRIEDVTDKEQEQRDREYEEKMEDEYAKREGGA